MDIASALKRCEVFVGLEDDDIEKIAGLHSWRRETYCEGEFVFKENVSATDFYILEDGEIRLLVEMYKTRQKKPTRVSVDTITKGDVFGWSSLVAPHSLTLSAVCIKDSSVLAVIGKELIALMDNDHSLGYEVMKGLVRVIGARLRDLRGRLVGKKEKLSRGRYLYIE